MNLRGSLYTVFSICLFSVVVVLPFLPWETRDLRAAFFEIEIRTENPNYAQIYYDVGEGYSESNSHRLRVRGGNTAETYRFGLSAGTLRSLRFDPSDGATEVSIRHAKLIRSNGRLIHEFAPQAFVAQQQIASLTVDGDALRIETIAGANDPILNVQLPGPLRLGDAPAAIDYIPAFALRPIIALGLALAGLRLLGVARREKARAKLHATWEWLSARPATAIWIAALLVVAASCYPVLLLGKSYVSPNFSDGTFLLYEQFPTLPGYTSTETESARGSDVGAIIWQQVPYSAIQSRALAQGELPLWNRYNSGGTVLLGQVQSMFGDPLHFLVLAAGGASWAWDLKYLVAKWLFCAGIGFTVWRCARHLPSALLSTLAAAFVGFFVYRLDHPAFFSFCYAPWILVAWLFAAEAANFGQLTGAGLLLMLANLAEMHSGTAKEAYALLGSLNFSGLCVLLASPRPWTTRLKALGVLAWAGVLFVLLTSISWTTFLESLKQAHTSYDTAMAFQIMPSVALGFFDEIFYRPLVREEWVFNPSANFLVLGGFLYAIAAAGTVARYSHARALAWSALPPALLTFGVIPPQWIVKLPFLGNFHHIDNSFSCVLIVLLTVVAGLGWRAAFTHLGSNEGRRHLKAVAVLLAVLVGLWLAFSHTVQRPTFGVGSVVTLHNWGEKLKVSAFVWASLLALPCGLFVFFWSLRRLLIVRTPEFATVLLLTMGALAMLWRFGMHATALGPKDYVFTPMTRARFNAVSPAIAAIKSDMREPSRVIGMGGNLFPGWSSVYDLENAAGADAIVNPHYRELVDAIGLETIWGWRIYVTSANAAQQRAGLDFLNVRYYVDEPGDQQSLGSRLTTLKVADLAVYRSETSWPRAFFSRAVVSYDSPQELAALIRQKPGVPFAALKREELANQPGLQSLTTTELSAGTAPARDYRLRTNETEFTVDASGPGIAVLHEAWLPKSFRATLNGRKVPVVRVNHAFKGVAVPAAGTYRIRFTYRPAAYTMAEYMTGIGAVLLLGSLIGIWSRKTRTIRLP